MNCKKIFLPFRLLIITPKQSPPQMKLIDLTHTLETGMLVFPGDKPPSFNKVLTHQKDGTQVTAMSLETHNGTHIDCPLHFIENGKSTDTASPETFFGTAIMIDCREFGAGEEITVSHIKKAEIGWAGVSWVLIYTGWYENWGTKKYFDQYPVLSLEAAKFICEKKILGIGLDVISIDAINSTDYPVHNLVLGKGVFVLENLTNLELIDQDVFQIAAFPLKIKNGDGSPVRAVAILD